MKEIDKEKYPLVLDLPSLEIPGVYAAFKKSTMKNVCQYVGGTYNLLRRCFGDHQKPSQLLLARLLLGKDGFCSWNGPLYKSKFDSYHAYYLAALEARKDIEFRFLDENRWSEWEYIRDFEPLYNINK
tara:strand:+ start:371 stop:754 length:384 start_codon:yes stop_codon:yes gene_type:complete